MAGNMYEWTIEAYASKCRVYRDGNYDYSNTYNSLSYHNNDSVTISYFNLDFCFGLYIK